MANLPAELVDLLLDEFHYFEDRLILEACGLVCKLWLHASRERVFADIYLHKDNLASFCDIVDSAVPLPPITDFVRRLTLEYSEDPSLGTLYRRLVPFPGVKFLTLEMTSEMLDRHSNFFGITFPNLSTLDIAGADTGSMASIFDTAASFPSVNALKIRDLDHRQMYTHSVPPTYRFPVGLRAIDLAASDVDNFFRAVLALDTVPAFSSVSTWNAWPDENSELGKYLGQVGPGVHHLCLDSFMCETGKEFATDPSALCNCTGLKSLKISADNEEAPRILLKVLPHLRSSELVSIALENSAYHDTSPSSASLGLWHRIDESLAREQFAGLNALIIIGCGWTGWSGEDSAEHMPSLVAREILQLV
ncbi:hypothetical protein FB451DRAFT_1264095 [Mycena latifolia]|nr:hypothetical protein FB451DRAFT_1264095 [Mycena latifolia]